jgi:hypothetical protein
VEETSCCKKVDSKVRKKEIEGSTAIKVKAAKVTP